MPYKRLSKRRPSWIRTPLVILGLLYLISFGEHLWKTLEFFFYLGLFILGVPDISLDGYWRHLSIVNFTLFFGFFTIFFLWLFLISSQALLPVKKFRKDWGAARRSEHQARRAGGVAGIKPRYAAATDYSGWRRRIVREEAPQLRLPPELSNLMEEVRTAWHLLLYILRSHGLAVFIRDGQVHSTLKELQRHGPGVAVIDFNSAVVFEEMVPPPGLSRPARNMIIQTLIALGLSDPLESPRARGAGIVFTRRRERIRGAIDLRRQFRLRPQIHAYTRDGIELKAAVWVLFTIGQEPDVLEVAFDGERRPENLRILKLEPTNDGRIRVADITDDLEEDDRTEINHYFWVDNRRSQFSQHIPLEPLASLPVFDPNRVYAAVSSQARTAEEKVVPWDELPLEKAIDSYRDILQSANYDEFFGALDEVVLPLTLFKKKQRLAMVNNGVLAYRHVRHYKDATLQKNSVYREDELRVSVIRQLTTPKLLRERGIKVIASGFGELIPIDEAIYRQRLDNWQAPWQKDAEILRARQDLEAMRIRSRARAAAQRSLTQTLADILKKHPHSNEIAALRILQALESAASDPHTKQLLPADTINLIRTIRELLLPIEPRMPPTQ